MATARVLYWNVNNFSSEKIATVTRKRARDDDDFLADTQGTGRLRMMMDTFDRNRIPGGAIAGIDFIIVVEVYARVGVPVQGETVGGNALLGCVNLLNELNQGNFNTWALVPPVVTGTDGYREAIAVYYRSDRWYFLGPNDWGANYDLPLHNGLPNRTIPANYPYRAGLPERRSAGQWAFPVPAAMGFVGPAQIREFPAAANRKPWLTAFGRVGNTNRLVRLTTIHTTPNQLNGPALADQGTAALATVTELTTQAAVATQQIDVILGDFNVDNMTQANFQAGGPFGALVGQGQAVPFPAYTPLIRPPVGLNAQYNSYYHTHGAQPYLAAILDDDENPEGYYPGYGYTDESLDNALVRYTGLVPPPSNMTILNRVDYTPYDAPNPVPVPAPVTGYYENGYWMDESVDAIIARAPDPLYDLNQYFRSWDNYGLVHSVSDHFALLFDI